MNHRSVTTYIRRMLAGESPVAESECLPPESAARERLVFSLRTLVAELALDLLGTPYRYGGAHPEEGFDCSGLVFYTFTESGLSIPRTSQAQFKAARKISIAQADPGDLVFFQDQTKLSHVGIYLGNGRFVHAPASGRSVSVASLTAPYYQRHLVAVGRLLPD
jgi:cell wall-associated NlpC family hydrolase